ncbi:hypothetical protein TgHK011_007842 [Trichoderma gracile]|nr:hypothetical protein TgHK011_007842 [Trichoderma gracile]
MTCILAVVQIICAARRANSCGSGDKPQSSHPRCHNAYSTAPRPKSRKHRKTLAREPSKLQQVLLAQTLPAIQIERQPYDQIHTIIAMPDPELERDC